MISIEEIKSCYTCRYLYSEGGYEEGYYGYSCYERETENDKRFPYKFTKCKKFKSNRGCLEIYEGEVVNGR